MYNIDTDLLFPPRVIPTLRSLRGPAWRELIDHVLQQEPTSLDRLAFVLLMIRLGNCIACHADSFRALRGCTHCAQQTVRRFRGSDQELLTMFADAQAEIQRYMSQPVEG